MCLHCVKEEHPDRENICLDNGSYLMNFAGCAQCEQRDTINIVNRKVTEEEDSGDEIITYQHVCQHCNHVIANHEHTFRIEEQYQIYEMQCALCGHAEDERSIMPYDPRGPKD